MSQTIQFHKLNFYTKEATENFLIKNIYESKLLKKIDVIVLEWHDKGPYMIEEILKDSGFDFFSRSLSSVSGMIYAFKREL